MISCTPDTPDIRDTPDTPDRPVEVAVHLTEMYHIKPLLVCGRLVINDLLYKLLSAFIVAACDSTT